VFVDFSNCGAQVSNGFAAMWWHWIAVDLRCEKVFDDFNVAFHSGVLSENF